MSKFSAAILCLMGVVLSLLLSSCMAASLVVPAVSAIHQIDQQQKMKLSREIMTDPDPPAWYEARERVIMAMGDRVVDGEVDSVYQACITAISSLDVTIASVEKESGFLSGSGKILPPDRAEAVRRERMVEYAKVKGFSPRAADPSPFFDASTVSSIMEQQAGVTVTVGPHGAGQTKIKVRFSKIYYPPELEQCYAVFWQAIDRQGFLNRALDEPAGV